MSLSVTYDDVGNHTSTFEYGPDRQHYKRVDNNGINITTILTVGAVEFISVDGIPNKTKRYIGMADAVSASGGSSNPARQLYSDDAHSAVEEIQKREDVIFDLKIDVIYAAESLPSEVFKILKNTKFEYVDSTNLSDEFKGGRVRVQ